MFFNIWMLVLVGIILILILFVDCCLILFLLYKCFYLVWFMRILPVLDLSKQLVFKRSNIGLYPILSFFLNVFVLYLLFVLLDV